MKTPMLEKSWAARITDSRIAFGPTGLSPIRADVQDAIPGRLFSRDRKLTQPTSDSISLTISALTVLSILGTSFAESLSMNLLRIILWAGLLASTVSSVFAGPNMPAQAFAAGREILGVAVRFFSSAKSQKTRSPEFD
jgi:hypothetical protein